MLTKSGGFNSVVSETLEKLEKFINISYESENNFMKLYIGEYHPHSAHILLW